MTTTSDDDEPTDVGSAAAAVAEELRILVVAGVAVGVFVGGVLSRLAMFVLRVTSPDGVRGVTSDDGFEIGRFTLGGTYSLLLLGASVGVIGAAAYQWVAPWLLGPTWFRRATLAAASGAVVGSMLLHADGVDFTLLEPTWLAITLFVALPAVFGLLIGPAVDGVSSPASWTRRGRRRWLLPLVLVACFPLTLPLLAVATAVFALWLAVRPAARAAVRRSTAVGLVLRGAWLGVAFLGLVAVVGDIRDITA